MLASNETFVAVVIKDCKNYVFVKFQKQARVM